MRRKILVGVLVFLGLLASAFLVYTIVRAMPRTVVVERTPNGFEPRTIHIKVGDTVEFRNSSETGIWPASDSHPTHSFYSVFDPMRAVAPGESWRFTFDEVGVWSYHDHMSALVRGMVDVSSRNIFSQGESSIETCLTSREGSTAQAACWGAELSRIISEQGLDAALDTFAELYKTNTAFAGNCHDVMHILGKEAYLTYHDEAEVVIRPETTYCAYGFYHGFVEEMLALNGGLAYDEARNYCEALLVSPNFASPSSAKRASDACYHGVGHAFFDTLPSSLWGDERAMVAQTTAQCEKLTEREDMQILCGSGIYNSLANAYTARAYELERPSDPVRICKEIPDRYRQFCYMELSIGYLRTMRIPHERALTFLRTIEKKHYHEALFAYIDDIFRHRGRAQSADDAYELCRPFTDTQELRTCIRGALFTFAAAGNPGSESAPMLSLCTKYEGGTRSYCLSETAKHMRSLMPEPDRIALCNTLSPNDARLCRDEQ